MTNVVMIYIYIFFHVLYVGLINKLLLLLYDIIFSFEL